MEATGFSILTAIIFIPIIAGVVILFLDGKNRDLVRGVGVTAAAAVLALSLAVFFGYDNFVKTDGGLIETQRAMLNSGAALSGAQMFADALAFEQRVVWVESLGIAYHVGVDGVSAPMVLLTGMVAVAGVLISWNIQDRLREFMAFFMFLVAGVYGVFIAVDLFMLFFFYELSIFPMYLLIAGWGWVKLREYAAMKLTLYILVGSVFALVAAVAMYFAAGAYFAGSGADVFQAALASGLLPADSGPYSWSMVQMTLAAGKRRLCHRGARHRGLELRAILVPLHVHGLRRFGRRLPLPQLVARWPRGRAHRRLDDSRRRIDEGRRICRLARGCAAAARWR